MKTLIPIKKDDPTSIPDENTKKKTKLIICNSTSSIRDALRVLGKDGVIILYKSYNPELKGLIRQVTPLSIPYSAAIFNNMSVGGFRLETYIDETISSATNTTNNDYIKLIESIDNDMTV